MSVLMSEADGTTDALCRRTTCMLGGSKKLIASLDGLLLIVLDEMTERERRNI